MDSQDSNNKVLIGIIIVLAAVIVGGGAYFLFFQKKDEGSKELKTETSVSAPTVADITDDKDSAVTEKETALGKLECVKDQKPNGDYCKINSSKIRNARAGVTYTLTELTKEDSLASDFEKLAKITIDSKDAKQVKIAFNKDIVERYYGTSGYGYTIDVSFDRDVASTKIAGFGQGVGDEYIFFIMKDGTVDILQIATMIKDKNFNPHRIKGVEDISAILGGSSYNEYGGGHTNYAVRRDQTAYDLQTLLPSWGVE